jgi:hypothetical protein
MTALQKAKEALKCFNSSQGSLQCVLQLGDIVDGRDTREESIAEFELVASEFDGLVRVLMGCYLLLYQKWNEWIVIGMRWCDMLSTYCANNPGLDSLP